MSKNDHRIILSDNAVLSDLSVNLNNSLSGTETIAVVAAEDKLYLGSILPFNGRWFEIDGANVNAAASVVSIKIWNGETDGFVSAVDVVDETAVAGATLAQSGYISWVTDKDEGWIRDDTLQNSTEIPALNTVVIYDLYWIELTFSGDLTVTTALKYVGQKFANDEDLGVYYRDLLRSNVLTKVAAGKTTWDDEHFEAAKNIVKDLKSKNILKSDDQILNPEVFRLAGIHKTAEIIYGNFGRNGEAAEVEARNKYIDALDVGIYQIDRDFNARKTDAEKFLGEGFFQR